MSVPAWQREPLEIPIADASVCTAACREIYAQRARWRMRILNEQPPFYTLGAASYLDRGFTNGPLEDYLADAGSLWQWAGEAVRTVVDNVRTRLEERLAQPVEYPPMLPSPGFHIFIGRAIPLGNCSSQREDCASCHFDLQHEYIPWAQWYSNVDLTNTLSFTLPLNLPSRGGGLMYWPDLTVTSMREIHPHRSIRGHRHGGTPDAGHGVALHDWESRPARRAHVASDGRRVGDLRHG